jgi:hypothetical protein
MDDASQLTMIEDASSDLLIKFLAAFSAQIAAARIGHRTHNGRIALARFPPDGTFGWQRVHPKVPLGGNARAPPAARARAPKQQAQLPD